MTWFTDRTEVFTWPIEYPRFTAVIVAAVVGVIAFALPQATVDFSIEQLYPQDSTMAAEYREHVHTYGADDTVFFAVRAGNPWADEIAMAEQAIGDVPGIESTLSPFSMERLQNADGVIETRPIEPGDDSPLIRGTVVATDERAGAIIARVAETHNNHTGRDDVVSAVEGILDRISGEWHLAGMPIIRTAYVRLVLQDLFVLVPLSILTAGIFFILSFRDPRQVVLGLISIALGLMTSAAAYVLAGGVLNTFSPAFFAVVIVVGTSDLIHLVHRFSDHINDHHAPLDADAVKHAARAAAQEIGFSCLLTTATTAVGFLALAWTDLPTVQQFGLGAGAGVILTYITTFLVVPPVLARMTPPSAAARRHAAEGGQFIRSIGRKAVAHRRSMLGAFAVATIAMVVMGSQTTVAYRILADLTGSKAGESQLFMEEHMGAVLPMAVDIRVADDAREPRTSQAIADFTEWVRAEPLVGHASSITDVLAESWSALGGTPTAGPETREAAAQALFLSSLTQDDPVRHLMVEEGRRTRVLLRIKDEGGDAMVALSDRIEREAQARLGPVGATAHITGVAHVIQWINRTLTIQFAGSFVIALVLIGAAWTVVTRSLRRVAIALIPNVLPLLAVLAGLGAIGVPLKPTTAMVFSIGLGIAVDDTIHFLTAYERHRTRHPGSSANDAVDHAYATAGRSMFDTSLVLIAGLMTLGASEFNGFLTLGGFTAWAVLAALLTDILLLGPLLVALDKR